MFLANATFKSVGLIVSGTFRIKESFKMVSKNYLKKEPKLRQQKLVGKLIDQIMCSSVVLQ